jgi:hypothetical protein
MGGPLGSDSPCAKGPIPYCLDECSKGRAARHRLTQLSTAIKSLSPDYGGLETVFDRYLVSHVPQYQDPKVRQDLAAHLKRHWFDDSSTEAYFPNQRVAATYAEGVLKALELSLERRHSALISFGQRPVPINAWWIVVDDLKKVQMLTLAEVDRVTLLIVTPRPPTEVRSATPILGMARAWVTEQRDGRVVTRKVENRAQR